MGSAALAAGITATAATAASATSAGVSSAESHKARQYNRWALNQQRQWSLEDTADQRAYAESIYNKYESPEAMRKQYEAAGYSPLAAIGTSAQPTVTNSMNKSDTSAAMAGNASASQLRANGVTSAMSQIANGVGDAAMQYEQIRSLKLDNDFKAQQQQNQNDIFDMPVTMDDFPRLYGFDEKWFKQAEVRLGHQVTFRDMLSMALAKQVVLQCNATPTDWKDGFTFESARNQTIGSGRSSWHEDGFDVSGQHKDGSYYYVSERKHGLDDSVVSYLGQVLVNDLRNSNSTADLNELMRDWELYRKQEGGWKAEKSNWDYTIDLNNSNKDFITFDNWYKRINGAIGDILDHINVGATIFKALTGYKSGGKEHNNYKH